MKISFVEPPPGRRSAPEYFEWFCGTADNRNIFRPLCRGIKEPVVCSAALWCRVPRCMDGGDCVPVRYGVDW